MYFVLLCAVFLFLLLAVVARIRFLFLAHFFSVVVCVLLLLFPIWYLRKSKITQSMSLMRSVRYIHITRKTYKLKNSATFFFLASFLSRNDELFRKYKSMSLATLCHKHIFTANTHIHLDMYAV